MRLLSPAAISCVLLGLTGSLSAQPVNDEPLLRIGLGSLTRSAVSPDGSLVITSGGGGVYTWDGGTGEVEQHLDYPNVMVFSLALSADGTMIATGGNDWNTRVWDTATGDQIHNFTVDLGIPRALEFSPDGSLLAAGGDDSTIRVWDLSGGTLEHAWSDFSSTIRGLRMDAAGERLVAWASSEATVRLYDVATGDLLHELTGLSGAPSSVAISPGGTRVAAGRGGEVLLYDAVSGNLIDSLDTPSGSATADLEFAPDSSVLVSSATTRLRAYDADDGTMLTDYMDATRPFAFSPDGALLAGGGTGANRDSIVIVEVSSGAVLATTPKPERPGTVQFAAGGEHILVTHFGNPVGSGRWGFAHLYDASTAGLVASFDGHMDSLLRFEISPDEAHLLGRVANSNAVFVRPIAADSQPHQIPDGHGLGDDFGHFSPDSAHAAVTRSDGRVSIHDPLDGTEVQAIDAYSGVSAQGVRYSNSGDILAVTYGSSPFSPGDWVVRFFDPETLDVLETAELDDEAITVMRWSPDDSILAAGTRQGTILLLDPSDGETLHSLDGPPGASAFRLHFSPDGERLHAHFDGENAVRVYDPDAGTLLETVSHPQAVADIALSPSGDVLATVTADRYLTAWDTATWAELGSIQTAYFQFNGVSIAGTGGRIAVGGSILGPQPPEIRIYDPSASELVERLRGHGNSARAIQHINSAQYLLSVGQDGLILVWEPLLAGETTVREWQMLQ